MKAESFKYSSSFTKAIFGILAIIAIFDKCQIASAHQIRRKISPLSIGNSQESKSPYKGQINAIGMKIIPGNNAESGYLHNYNSHSNNKGLKGNRVSVPNQIIANNFGNGKRIRRSNNENEFTLNPIFNSILTHPRSQADVSFMKFLNYLTTKNDNFANKIEEEEESAPIELVYFGSNPYSKDGRRRGHKNKNHKSNTYGGGININNQEENKKNQGEIGDESRNLFSSKKTKSHSHNSNYANIKERNNQLTKRVIIPTHDFPFNFILNDFEEKLEKEREGQKYFTLNELLSKTEDLDSELEIPHSRRFIL